MKKSLVISTFPPRRCGIGTYAAEQVNYLKQHRSIVTMVGLDDDSGGHLSLDMRSIRSLLKTMAKLAFRRFDEAYLHYTDGFFPLPDAAYPKQAAVALTQALFLFFLCFRFGRKFHLSVHEIHCRPVRGRSWDVIRKFFFKSCKNLDFHTQAEVAEVKDYFGLTGQNMKVLPHGRYMTPYFDKGKDSARRGLGIPQDETVILCIGFVQRHKQFDLVVDAVKRLPKGKVKLYVVGSMRVPAPEIVEYRDELSSLIDGCEDAEFREDFVSDIEFDQWIAAADLVVLPYEEIWSTGVGARCELLATPMIMRRLPSLVSQFEGNSSVDFFDDIEELTEKLGQTVQKEASYVVDSGKKSSEIWKVLFIMPWFGPEIRGGAEHFIFELAKNWSKRGADVEVWATSSSKLEGWNNEFPTGNEVVDGVKIRRFPAVKRWEPLFHRLHARMNQGASNAFIRWLWVRTNLFGVGMTNALREAGPGFDSVHLCHYLTGTAHRLSRILPEKTVLHPFIHNEQVLYDPVMAQLFENVRGVMVNTASERDLALSAQCGLVPRSYHEIGNGVELEDLGEESRELSTEIRETLGSKFIVFVGRLIEQKNIGELLAWFFELRKVDPDVQLVFIGEGPYLSESLVAQSPGIVKLGWVSEGQKRAVISEAICLVQPSLLESFSLVIMEAWLQGTPVIVHKDCPATSQHITASNGGYACKEATEFVSAIDQLMDPGKRKELGGKGEQYVRVNYSWDAVVGRLEKAVRGVVS